jgi:hypothetical protein
MQPKARVQNWGGKIRSRRNAVRHGLSAETVIEIVEDIEDYKGFEAAIIADYDARTAVERELVLRLASLLWRLCFVAAPGAHSCPASYGRRCSRPATVREPGSLKRAFG